MKKLILSVVLLLVGCTSPEEIIIIDNSMSFGTMGIRAEYRCPLCAKQYKTEFLAQQCIDGHEK